MDSAYPLLLTINGQAMTFPVTLEAYLGPTEKHKNGAEQGGSGGMTKERGSEKREKEYDDEIGLDGTKMNLRAAAYRLYIYIYIYVCIFLLFSLLCFICLFPLFCCCLSVHN